MALTFTWCCSRGRFGAGGLGVENLSRQYSLVAALVAALVALVVGVNDDEDSDDRERSLSFDYWILSLLQRKKSLRSCLQGLFVLVVPELTHVPYPGQEENKLVWVRDLNPNCSPMCCLEAGRQAVTKFVVGSMYNA